MSVTVNEEWCKGCGRCIDNCPKNAIAFAGKYNSNSYQVVTVNDSLCIQCGICYTVCPDWVFTIGD